MWVARVQAIAAGFALAIASVLLVSAVPVTAVAADDLGRLFTTPKQRAVLDNIRRKPGYKMRRKKKSSSANNTVRKGLEIDGVVIRDDGKNTVWINGKSNLKTNSPQAGVHVQQSRISSDSVTVTISNPNKRITLKPGQSIDPVTGRVRESYKVK